MSETQHVTGGCVIKDSGTRRDFDTGSVRDAAEGKGRMDLLPMWALERLSKHFEAGCKKYGDRNWEKGQPLSVYMDSALRHLFKHVRGERDEDHLVAAAWNIMCAMDTEARIKAGLLSVKLADLPDSIEKQLEDLHFEDMMGPQTKTIAHPKPFNNTLESTYVMPDGGSRCLDVHPVLGQCIWHREHTGFHSADPEEKYTWGTVPGTALIQPTKLEMCMSQYPDSPISCTLPKGHLGMHRGGGDESGFIWMD